MYQLLKYDKHFDFKWLEDRLRPIGFRMVFCTRSPESFAAARTERLKISGNPSQYDDLKLFMDEQKLLLKLVSLSTLPTLTIDVSDNDVPNAVENIADWLEQTDGLYM
jgi:transcriptional/translational regulatory protein YebC/TACO1